MRAVTSAITRVRVRTSRGWTCWADFPTPIDEWNSCAARPTILSLSVDLNLENSSWRGKCLFYEFPIDSTGLDFCSSRPAGIWLTSHCPGVEVEKAVIRSSLCVRAKHIRCAARLAFRHSNAQVEHQRLGTDFRRRKQLVLTALHCKGDAQRRLQHRYSYWEFTIHSLCLSILISRSPKRSR